MIRFCIDILRNMSSSIDPLTNMDVYCHVQLSNEIQVLYYKWIKH